MQWDAIRITVEFHHVADAVQLQWLACNPQPPHGQNIAAQFRECFVMRPLMQDVSFHRAYILRPQVFNVNQRPLPAAEREMLNA